MVKIIPIYYGFSYWVTSKSCENTISSNILFIISKKQDWQELDLEKITSTNDYEYELSQVNRRTITENGVTQAVCEIGQVPIWSSDLKLLPNMPDVNVNFLYNVIHGKNGKAH
jgi:hypothetical protein